MAARTLRAPPRPSRQKLERLRKSLDTLLSETETGTELTRDPLRFPHRYSVSTDIEIAAVLSACLAFGRVASFLPVLERLFGIADQHGGPAKWAMEFDSKRAQELADIGYRWTRGHHIALLVGTLGEALRRTERLGTLFESHVDPNASDMGSMLDQSISALHEIATAETDRLALPSGSHRERGFVSLLSRPSGGSACKRMCMLLRWMSRIPSDGAAGIDLGLWAIPTRQLVIPLDTHVLHTAQLIGLTHRKDGSWRTAVEITKILRKICPTDPVRYDFAIAHLGIGGKCLRQFSADICNPCALRNVCRHGGRRR